MNNPDRHLLQKNYGTIVDFDHNRGYGFAITNYGLNGIFLHITKFKQQNNQHITPDIGDNISFILAKSMTHANKYEGIDIEIIKKSKKKKKIKC